MNSEDLEKIRDFLEDNFSEEEIYIATKILSEQYYEVVKMQAESFEEDEDDEFESEDETEEFDEDDDGEVENDEEAIPIKEVFKKPAYGVHKPDVSIVRGENESEREDNEERA